MGYLTEYKERRGKCEFCVCHNNGGYSGCHECYGSNFKDKLDLLTYIKIRVRDEATVQFDESDDGKVLLEAVEQTKETYNRAIDQYNKAKSDFIESQMKKIEDKLDVFI